MTADSRTAEVIQRERAALRTEFGELYDWLAQTLYEDDPVGINCGQSAEEYAPEVGTILPRLSTCTSAVEMQVVMHEEFCRWFDPEEAGPVERYDALASALWERFQRGKR